MDVDFDLDRIVDVREIGQSFRRRDAREVFTPRVRAISLELGRRVAKSRMSADPKIRNRRDSEMNPVRDGNAVVCEDNSCATGVGKSAAGVDRHGLKGHVLSFEVTTSTAQSAVISRQHDPRVVAISERRC